MKKKIIKKTDIKDYCVWYLKEIQKTARAVEMVSYALEHKLVAKNTPLNSEIVASRLRDQNIFNKEKDKWGTLVYRLNPDFDYNKWEEYM